MKISALTTFSHKLSARGLHHDNKPVVDKQSAVPSVVTFDGSCGTHQYVYRVSSGSVPWDGSEVSTQP